MNTDYLFASSIDHGQAASASHMMHHEQHTEHLTQSPDNCDGDDRLMIWQQFLVSTIPPIVASCIKVRASHMPSTARSLALMLAGWLVASGSPQELA